MPANNGLSAPEAFVLISLPRWNAPKALKLGLMGLIAQGALGIEQEERRGVFRSRSVPHLHVSHGLPQDLPPVAASLVRVVGFAEPDGLMPDVVRQAVREYGRKFVDFVRKLVGPALVARGLAEPYQRWILGLFPVNSFRRTPAGDTEKARLQNLLREARAIPGYLDRDPAQAVALVAALGAAVLLAEELRPHYQAIGDAMRQRQVGDGGGGGDGGGAGDGGGSASDGGTFGPGDTPHNGHGQFDPGALDFSGGVDFGGGLDFGSIDFSAFDAGAFDSFDAGFSDAGGDGGGDGGGGDGGGGDGSGSGC